MIGIPAAISNASKLLLAILKAIDPKTRDWVRKRKALEWAEKYIFINEEIEKLKLTTPFTDKQVKSLDRLLGKRKYYRKWFFDYD